MHDVKRDQHILEIADNQEIRVSSKNEYANQQVSEQLILRQVITAFARFDQAGDGFEQDKSKEELDQGVVRQIPELCH
jgi:hypothetical protein